MDHISEIIMAVIFFLFTAFAFIRRAAESQDIQKRNLESDWEADDLPEETRRMLFGDPAAPTARQAQPKTKPDPFGQVRDVLNELKRQMDVQTAKPRQSAPRMQTPAIPPQAAAPRQSHPLQPQFRTAQQPQPTRPATQRHAASPQRPQSQPRHVSTQRPSAPPRPQAPRMVPQQNEGAMQRQVQAQQQRPAPMPKRQQQRSAVRMMEPDEGPTTPFPAPAQKRARSRPSSQHSRWLSNPDDLRRGIVLREILGPPKAMQEF